MIEPLEVEYGGATLAVEIEPTHARLRINGLVRDAAEIGAGSLRLSSTVQTGYEWHEFIEAIITIKDESILVSLSANGAELASSQINREALLS